jgi:nitrogen fixation protein NifU and related proteins
MDHVRNPRNAGELEDANASCRVRSSADGDMLQLQLRIEEGRILKARFKVFGCGAAIASGSILTEMMIGKTVADVQTITNEQLSAAMGGLPPEKTHCSVLAEQAIRAAILNWKPQK